MRRYFRAVLLTALLLFAVSVSAYADQAIVTGDGVNVRNGPGTAYGISTSIVRGQTVEILDRTNPDWYLISLDGRSGYVSSQFLTLSEENAPSEVSVNNEETAGMIHGTNVYFRSGPSTSSTILGTYDTGKPLTITGSSGDWISVRIDGKDGYVFSEVVQEQGKDAAADINTASSQGGTLLTPVGDLPASSVTSGGSTVFTLQEELTVSPEATLPPDQIVQVPTDGTVRTVMSAEQPAAEERTSGSEDTSDAVGSFSGTLIPVAEPRLIQEITPSPELFVLPESVDTPVSSSLPEFIVNSDFYTQPVSVSSESNTGEEVLSEAEVPVGTLTLKFGRVTGNGVRLRTGPGSTYSIVGTYDSGTEVAVTGISGDWIAVKLPASGVSGYIYSDFIVYDESGEQNVSNTSGISSASGNYGHASDQIRDGYITGSSVRLRESPSMSAGILDELNSGTAVRITGVSDGWYRVIVNGMEGYVSASFVAEGIFEPVSRLSDASGTELGKEIAAYALQLVGTPYKWGGQSPETGFDCSGFVQHVSGQFGYTTSRVANDALSDGTHVDPSDLQPGDLLCFYSGSNYVGHLGIYVGNGMFVHAANSATGVVTTSLTEGYYAKRGYEIRRIQ